MTKQLIYLIGEPGAGKSTLMARATAHLERHTLPGQPPRDGLFRSGDLAAVELGRRRGEFSGTDALGMAVIEQAIPWLFQAEAPLVLGEGARLGNARFLSAAVSAGFAVSLLLLDHPMAPVWRAERARRLGKAQSDTWVRGARTRALKLADNPPLGVAVWRGDPPAIADVLAGFIDGRLG